MLSVRNELFAQGLYPGVDYEILENSSEDGTVTVRPAYPLVKKLERDWPVTVSSDLAPRWMDPMAYNILTTAFGLALGAGLVALGLVLSSCLTLSVVPSASMQPTIEPGDVVLVEKVTPRLPHPGTSAPYARGDLVFFQPPEALQEIVRQRTGGASQRGGASDFQGKRLFVKRVAAIPGDVVSVSDDGSVSVTNAPTEKAGPPISPASQARLPPFRSGSFRLRDGEVYVLGDNGDVSIDSRCWGALNEKFVAGRPLLRVAPLDRAGFVR